MYCDSKTLIMIVSDNKDTEMERNIQEHGFYYRVVSLKDIDDKSSFLFDDSLNSVHKTFVCGSSEICEAIENKSLPEAGIICENNIDIVLFGGRTPYTKREILKITNTEKERKKIIVLYRGCENISRDVIAQKVKNASKTGERTVFVDSIDLIDVGILHSETISKCVDRKRKSFQERNVSACANRSTMVFYELLFSFSEQNKPEKTNDVFIVVDFHDTTLEAFCEALHRDLSNIMVKKASECIHFYSDVFFVGTKSVSLFVLLFSTHWGTYKPWELSLIHI